MSGAETPSSAGSPNGSCARFLYAFVDEEISHGIVGSPALNGLPFARLSFFLSPQVMRAFPSVALYGIPNACAIGTATKSIRHQRAIPRRMGHIKRGNCGIAQRRREREPPPTSTLSAGERRAYGQGAIASCIMALETAVLIALAITLRLAKR